MIRAWTGFRGQPLVALLVVLGGWTCLRIAFWETALIHPGPIFEYVMPDRGIVSGASVAEDKTGPALFPEMLPPGLQLASWGASALRQQEWRPSAILSPTMDLRAISLPLQSEMASLPRHDAEEAFGIPVSHSAPDPADRTAPFSIPPVFSATSQERRWGGESWMLLRKDTTTAVTSGRGSYGQSQLGAVLRYRLASGSAHRPAAYLRASRALAGAQETEAALGLSLRPLPSVPVRVAAEMRLMEVGGKVLAHPAAYAVTELPPVGLPLGFTGEAYAQGGYVGGDYATAFIDGQLRVDHEIIDLGDAELRAGGGAWGGAQKGVERVDIGPGATLSFRMGQVYSRVAVDWRFRVAGDAEPSSGPALTVSAGF